ncbi:LysR substrate-binding domain-containing protein [Streptomyces sp. KHY 26]
MSGARGTLTGREPAQPAAFEDIRQLGTRRAGGIGTPQCATRGGGGAREAVAGDQLGAGCGGDVVDLAHGAQRLPYRADSAEHLPAAGGEYPLRPSADRRRTSSLAAGVVPEAVRDLLEQTGPLRWSLLPGLSVQPHHRVVTGALDLAVVTDAPPGLPHDPRVERRFLGLDDMVVVLPADHPHAGRGPVPLQALADEVWAEDNDGSAALLRGHAARVGVGVHIDLTAADLPGELALVATGHAIALVPGVLTRALRGDVTTVDLVDAPTRGIRTVVPRRDPHPAAAPLCDRLATVPAFRPERAA